MAVRGATSVQDILANPIGAYLVGDSFLIWFHARLVGGFTFGRLAHADHPLLGQFLGRKVIPPGYDMLVDTSTVEVFDDRSFGFLTGFLELRGRESLADIRRFALVKPAGLAGAGVAGLFHEKIRAYSDAQLFGDRREALDWLGYAPDATERADIDEIIDLHFGVPPLVRSLRDWLGREIAHATLAGAARALATSERSLQRELARANTSFRTELVQARVRVAENLLTTTDDKVETIARHLGFRSVPAFTTLFHKVYGETPVELRRKRARG
jgi:AraC-like DNA-binding protein